MLNINATSKVTGFFGSSLIWKKQTYCQNWRCRFYNWWQKTEFSNNSASSNSHESALWLDALERHELVEDSDVPYLYHTPIDRI